MELPILEKEERTFREPSIFAADLKALSLDNVLVNLFMLLRNNGARIKVKLARSSSFHDINNLKLRFKYLEDQGNLEGYTQNPSAIESWLRSSLVNMVYRGKAKENVASLRPLHLESYRIRNLKHTKDYNAADQVFIMLQQSPEVMRMLKEYLSIGWDDTTRRIYDTPSHTLDVDTAALLHLIKDVSIDTKVSTTTSTIKPVLPKQAALFCDDVKRLLAYQNNMPRSVFIDYLRIIVGFHLSLYFQKLVYLLPKMVECGSMDIEDSSDWSEVVDVTDRLDSRVSSIACEDMNKCLNGVLEYVRATYKIKAMKNMVGSSCSVETALHFIKEPTEEQNADFRSALRRIYNNYSKDCKTAEELEEAKQHVEELEEYLRYEETPIDKYVECLMKVGAAYQLKYSKDFLDKASMKNQDSQLMMDGRSRKHTRRGAIGPKLLEVLVQLLVLEENENGSYSSSPLSINALIDRIRTRYGLVIDGSKEPRFANADIQTHLAFKENVDALKSKLRQIGFYTDLSDASSLQKIRPRYKFNM